MPIELYVGDMVNNAQVLIKHEHIRLMSFYVSEMMNNTQDVNTKMYWFLLRRHGNSQDLIKRE
jgi:hypothetical protein